MEICLFSSLTVNIRVGMLHAAKAASSATTTAAATWHTLYENEGDLWQLVIDTIRILFSSFLLFYYYYSNENRKPLLWQPKINIYGFYSIIKCGSNFDEFKLPRLILFWECFMEKFWELCGVMRHQLLIIWLSCEALRYWIFFLIFSLTFWWSINQAQ